MLIAVGIGPGDPELLTVKAVKLIKDADQVFVPGNVAKDIISPYRKDPVVLSFPMTSDEGYIRECMHKNADLIAPVAEKGLAVFCILGDPNFYGTFGRLCGIIDEKYPSVEYGTVPGISSITSFASAAGVSVNGGIFITDGSPESSRIFLKVKEPRKVIESLKTEGFREFVLAEKIFMKDQKIYRNEKIPEKSAYFSVMFARK
ncbi:precorrin-2/cobalt-factor-2 C20-methyltransferase [Methanomicrobium sp. W14]|uniref:cobalt-factor II C(20)-methyltransferase n=1 Tax=Methanomicrobium sp. W14 TaxID=2817839 RepID=UPI001AE83F10|nr:cobalt-factor II C(20)-methyltransferase [Methanomicrobium sp. W14]MBP2132751.1 precorrin-2/cobalt-factor-2 C20-methyltransferase [Methanomicrobium sp. W14]